MACNCRLHGWYCPQRCCLERLASEIRRARHSAGVSLRLHLFLDFNSRPHLLHTPLISQSLHALRSVVMAAAIDAPRVGRNDDICGSESTSGSFTMIVFATDDVSVLRPSHSLICVTYLAGLKNDHNDAEPNCLPQALHSCCLARSRCLCERARRIPCEGRPYRSCSSGEDPGRR